MKAATSRLATASTMSRVLMASWQDTRVTAVRAASAGAAVAAGAATAISLQQARRRRLAACLKRHRLLRQSFRQPRSKTGSAW